MASISYIIHTDGGARGNPGPAALGVVIAAADGSLKKEYGEYLGQTTNNVAEYQAVIFALKKLKQLIGKAKASEASVHIHVDSELLARQLNGQYKIKEANIQKLFLEAWNLHLDFGHVEFLHIPREQNRAADSLVNTVLNKESNKLL